MHIYEVNEKVCGEGGIEQVHGEEVCDKVCDKSTKELTVELALKAVVKFDIHDEAQSGACYEVIQGGPVYDEVLHEDLEAHRDGAILRDPIKTTDDEIIKKTSAMKNAKEKSEGIETRDVGQLCDRQGTENEWNK